MARGATIVTENNFVKGLITEGTAMNFPENAVTECDNVVFSEQGFVSRRNGIDLEIGGEIHELADLADNPGIYRQFLWQAVGSDGQTSFLVQQIGEKLYFFTVSGDSLSDKKHSFSIDLASRSVNPDTSTVGNSTCQFASGKGYLFVVHPDLSPFYVSYSSDTDTFTARTIRVEVRDFARLDDELDIDERPTSLTEVHEYNLFNQGWYVSAEVKDADDSGSVLDAWESVRTDYPSNADIWWIYKNGSEVAYFGENTEEGFVGPSNFTLGNTPAPNGHYIYHAWDINRTSMTGISGLDRETSGYARPECIAFYAGRIFYGGVSADKYTDRVYFSQIIESDDQFGKCYQINDPTSETVFDLLDTDGGVVPLPLVGKIISFRVVGDALIVLGTKGSFAIRGSDNGPFRATDYTVEFISDTPVVSDSSICLVDSSLIWWNYDAIYAMSKDSVGVSFQVENISKPTIQSLIDDIPSDNKLFVVGAYNKKDRIVQWLYSNTADSGTNFDKILELNVVSKAFYPYTINTDLAPRIAGLVTVSGIQRLSTLEDVVTTEVVTNNALDNVQVAVMSYAPNSEVFKYVTVGDIASGDPGFTYSEQTNTHLDWETIDDTGTFRSYFYSGYRIRGEMLRKFQSTPIAIVFRNTEDTQIVLKGIWDYGLRTTTPQTLQSTIEPADFIVKRIKLRGKGRSLQLWFEGVDDRPFELSGWATFDTGGQQP